MHPHGTHKRNRIRARRDKYTDYPLFDPDVYLYIGGKGYDLAFTSPSFHGLNKHGFQGVPNNQVQQHQSFLVRVMEEE